MLREWLKSIDPVVPFCVFALMSMGLVALYSTTQSMPATTTNYFTSQLVWILLGTLVVLIFTVVPFRLPYQLSYVLYALALILLVMALFWGTRVYGATRWLRIFGIGFQPSELAKIATMLAVARFLSDQREVNRPRTLILAAGIILVPFALIARQPDLGTGLAFIALILPALFWAGMKREYLFFILAPALVGILSFNIYLFTGAIVLISVVLYNLQVPMVVKIAHLGLNAAVGLATPLLWNQLHEYQQQRILTFMNPEADPLGAGYQIIQSKVAIGSGGWFGKGVLQGSQTQLRFLPEQHTDFIITVIGEELGFIGVAVCLLLFAILLMRIVYIANAVKSPFSSIAAVGIGTNIGFQMFVNVGMTISLFPVTGLPLPFISYGGTALLTNLMMVGLLLNFYRHKYEY